jgi:hypothetical protein
MSASKPRTKKSRLSVNKHFRVAKPGATKRKENTGANYRPETIKSVPLKAQNSAGKSTSKSKLNAKRWRKVSSSNWLLRSAFRCRLDSISVKLCSRALERASPVIRTILS